MKPRSLVVLTMVAVAVLIAVLVYAFWPSEEKTVRAAFVPAGYYLPFLVAKDQRLFEEQGYRLELTRYNDNTQMISQFVNGHLDVAAQSAFTMFPTASRHPGVLRFVYGQYARSYAFVVPAESRYVRLHDLSGATIGTWKSPTAEAFIRILLRQRGLSEGDDYTIQRFGATEWAPALQNAVVPVVFGFDAPMAALVASGEFRYLEPEAVPALLDSGVFNGGGFIASKLDETDPAKAAVIRSVLAEAVRIINDEPARARRILARSLGVSQSVAESTMLDDFTPLDSAALTSARQTLQLLTESGIVTSAVDLDAMLR